MGLERIMISEISLLEENDTIWFHLYLESKKQNKWTKELTTHSTYQSTSYH